MSRWRVLDMVNPYPFVGLIGVGVGLVMLIGRAVIEATTNSNASTGTVVGLMMIGFYGGQLLWAFVKRRRGRASDSHE